MNEISEKLFAAMHQFKRLKVGKLFPQINNADCMTLAAIEHLRTHMDGKLTVTELSAHMKNKMSAVSRSLKNLEDRGYIERTVNKTDRRNTYITLTDAGKREIKEIQDTINEFTEAVFSKMNEEDMCRLLEYLNQLYVIAEEEIELRSKTIRKEQE